MKKIMAILLLLSVAFAVPKETVAQNTPTCFSTPTKTQTSCESAFLDTGVDTLNLTLSGSSNLLIKVQFRATKSGGTAAGTARLYGSIYGGTSTWTAIGDTLTLANATVNQKVWNLTGNDLGWKYLRILRDGGTTMAGTQSAKAWAIKQ